MKKGSRIEEMGDGRKRLHSRCQNAAFENFET
jgi:hypothetical protein